MSHYIYKRKAFLAVPDGRIVPLCLYADSSLTDTRYDRHGRPHYFHPKSWCINTLSAEYGILISRQDFSSAVERAYQKEMDCIRECRAGSETPPCEPSGESYSYYGTVYPSGRKMKHMKAFYSVRHTIPAEQFLQENRFDIHISVYNPKDYKTIETQTVTINTAVDLVRAEQLYEELHGRADGKMCLGVYGLEGAD